MKLILISGPSGSGKTTLSNQILKKHKGGIVLSTDNYYKTGLISKLLSKCLKGYFDRYISFNKNLFKKDLYFIINKGDTIYQRSYDFKNKTIKKIIKRRFDIKFLVIEGIFAKELTNDLSDQNYFFLELKINKNECMDRVVKRDLRERGKLKKNAINDFLKSWDIYYDNFENRSLKKNTNEFIISKNTNIDLVLKKIFNLKI